MVQSGKRTLRRDASRAFQAGYDETSEAHPSREVPITTTRTHDVYVGVPLCDVSNSGSSSKALCRKSWKRVRCESDGSNGNGLQRNKPAESTHEFSLENGTRSSRRSSGGIRLEPLVCAVAKCQARITRCLYLVLYTPSGLYVFEHDGKFGVSTQGKYKTLWRPSPSIWSMQSI